MSKIGQAAYDNAKEPEVEAKEEEGKTESDKDKKNEAQEGEVVE